MKGKANNWKLMTYITKEIRDSMIPKLWKNIEGAQHIISHQWLKGSLFSLEARTQVSSVKSIFQDLWKDIGLAYMLIIDMIVFTRSECINEVVDEFLETSQSATILKMVASVLKQGNFNELASRVLMKFCEEADGADLLMAQRELVNLSSDDDFLISCLR